MSVQSAQTFRMLPYLIGGLGAALGFYAQNSNDLLNEQLKQLRATINTHATLPAHPWGGQVATGALKDIESIHHEIERMRRWVERLSDRIRSLEEKAAKLEQKTKGMD